MFKRLPAMLLLLLVSGAFSVQAANIIWISNSTANWNTAANWSPATVPTSTDVAVFNGTGTGNCSINTAVNIGGISVTAAYTGTITQNAFTVTTGTLNAVFSGGTFSGGSAALTCNGTLTLSGCAFTSTSGTLNIAGAFTFSSGSFSHNNGTVSFNTNSFSVTGSPVLNNVIFSPSFNTITFNNSLTVNGNFTIGSGSWIILAIASGQSVTVNGTLTLAGSGAVTINTGTINATGNITITNSSANTGGSGTLNINGTGSQTLTGSGTFNTGSLPNVIINKSGGTLTLASYITVAGPLWSYVAGTLNPGTSTVCFYQSGSAYTISGTHTLYNVVFYGYYTTYTISNDLTANDVLLDATLRCDVIVSSNLTVNGTLTTTGSGYFKLSTGTVNVKGNLVNNNTNTTATGGGTATLSINGTGSQSFTGTAAIYQGVLPPMVVNKSSGILTLSNYLTFYNGFTWTAGTVDPGTSTCVFGNASSAAQTVNASASGMSFYNVIFDQPDYLWTNLSSDISVAGSMTITAGSGIRSNSHTLYLGGNFTSLNTTAAGAGYVFNGSASLTLNGTSQQTITMNNSTASANKAILATLVVNNMAGRATHDDISLADILTVTGSATFTNGTMLTTSSKYLALNSGAIANTGNAASYVNGPLVYRKSTSGATILNLPLGVGADWRPAVLTANHSSATLYNYTAQVFSGNPWTVFGSGTNDMPVTVDTISGVHYWTIARTDNAGTSQPAAGLSGNQQIQLYFGTNDFVYQGATLTIVKNTNAAPATWIDIGGSSTLGNFSTPQAGSVTSTSSPTAFSSFSSFTLGSRASGWNSLPIELRSFTATPNQNKVDLKWETSTETSNAYFTLEKSHDAVLFDKLIDVPGAGSSLVYHEYFETDYQPYAGISYYRLKQTDFNGKSKYFPLVTVRYQPGKGISIYPNPAEDLGKLQIRVNGYANSEVLVMLRDMNGKDYYTKVHVINADQEYIVIGGTAGVPPGQYVVIASANDAMCSQKIIIK